MLPINSHFEVFLNELLDNSNNDRVLFVFKGFSINQIELIVKHPKSILAAADIIVENHLNLHSLNNKWFEILQSTMTTSGPLVGFYEELIAIRDFLPRLSMERIVIVDNNLLAPWIPCNLPYKDAVSLFDYFQTDHGTKDELINFLTDFYGDVKLLPDDHALLLPHVIEDPRIQTYKFWTEQFVQSTSPFEHVVEIGSIADWKFRLDIMNGFPREVALVPDKNTNEVELNTLAGALSTLQVPFTIENSNYIEDSFEYDDTFFRPLLKKYWGENAEFRPLAFYKDPDRSREIETVSQGQIISEIVDQAERALDGEKFQNVFITAPTGAGKSILFQLPALYLAEKHNCVTLVVSPLIALMNDQVDQLQRERGVSIAACINSTMSYDERLLVIDQIRDGRKSLLYLAPELLLTTHLPTFLGGRKVGLVVIDEAHTVTSWGRDFRSDYWFLGDFLKTSRRNGLIFPVLCLTATAVYSGEDDVVHDTINELGLDKTIIHLGSVRRNNITFDIARHDKDQLSTRVETAKINLTLARMRQYVSAGEKVLTYFPYRSQVDETHSHLERSESAKIRRYHGQVPTAERKMVEKSYKTGEALGLVCTKAFGMGIDVSDIKHVIHFAPTGTLADYVQEIGRAARKQTVQGIAHIDYFPSDLRYVRALNGISEMRQYQLKEMLKKICAIYEAKQRRNLLISAETFEYLFNEDEVENRTKSGLMLLAKDLANKYSFPVLIVKPKAMLSRNYINVPFEVEDIFLQKYGRYAQKQEGQTRYTTISVNKGEEVETLVYSSGNTYLLNMAEVWEEMYPKLTFGMFKKQFFETQVTVKGETYFLASPRVRAEIHYGEAFDVVLAKLEKVLDAISEIFGKYKHAESKQFTLQMFELDLNEALGEKVVAHDKLSLLIDIFTDIVDESAMYISSRSHVKVLRKRKQAGTDETVFFVHKSAYATLKNYFNRALIQCRPNIEDEVFYRFYPLVQDKPLEIMPLLRLLEVLELATYEIRGGEKAEVFIRINDPSKIQRLARTDYRNNVLQSIRKHHQNNANMLAAFFMKELSNDERWHLIEEYFLGNEAYVDQMLGIQRE